MSEAYGVFSDVRPAPRVTDSEGTVSPPRIQLKLELDGRAPIEVAVGMANAKRLQQELDNCLGPVQDLAQALAEKDERLDVQSGLNERLTGEVEGLQWAFETVLKQLR